MMHGFANEKRERFVVLPAFSAKGTMVLAAASDEAGHGDYGYRTRVALTNATGRWKR